MIVFKLYKSLKDLNYPVENFQPKVSIIVNLHNEEENISQLLGCLVQQDYPKEQLRHYFLTY